MSEPSCPNLSEPEWFKNPDNPNPNAQTRTRLGFKFGHDQLSEFKIQT